MNCNKVVEKIVNSANVVRATEYISPKLIVRAVRKLYGKKIIVGHNIEITLTIGRPNYLERAFIKDCQKIGEPFPVKKVQLKLYTIRNPKPKKVSRK